MKKSQQSNDAVLDFWRVMEALTAQEVARIDARDPDRPVYSLSFEDSAEAPWTSHFHTTKPLRSGYEWRYAAQCGVYGSDDITQRLVVALGGAQEDLHESGEGRARLFDLSFDRPGLPIGHTFSLSLAAWSAGQVLRAGGGPHLLQTAGAVDLAGLPSPESGLPEPASGFPGFDLLSRHLAQRVVFESHRMREAGTGATQEWLGALVKEVSVRIFGASAQVPYYEVARIRASKVKASGCDEEAAPHGAAASFDMLTSFYVEDLQRVRKALKDGRAGSGLLEFLSAGAGVPKSDRIDVRAPSSVPLIEQALLPSEMPAGRWPSDHSLVLSQQLAVNEAWAKLRDASGLFAVNGPPGTGKTTLLRDVAAAVITYRATILIKSRTGMFGPKRAHRLGDTWIPYYPLHERLQGHSIVICSENNGAVENVTLELPGCSAVPPRVREGSDYFQDLATRVTKKDAWGLVAAPRGNRANRTDFLQTFWWGSSTQGSTAASASVPGMRESLKGLQAKAVAPVLSWESAVARFTHAATAEEQIRANLLASARRPERLAELRARAESDRSQLAQLDASLDERDGALQAVEAKLAQLEKARVKSLQHRAAIEARSEAHREEKPGLLQFLATLGAAQRTWKVEHERLRAEALALSAVWLAQDKERIVGLRARELATAGIQAFEARADLLDRELDAILQNIKTSEVQLASEMEALGSRWPDLQGGADERERIEPWATDEWSRAREDLFIAALEVHRAFLEHHPTEMLANLSLAVDWLSGKQMPPELARTALDSLCLVVPVISTTFASVSRMFAQLGHESVGWALIDEAGQALPSHAVGAIWRARRTIVVGDPRQLEPVYTVPAQVEGAIAALFGVGQRWMPSYASVQGIADQTANWGTWLPGDRGEPMWVGCPLRLHRRCDEPAFSISNRLAYGGMMVHGKPLPTTPGRLMASGWIDVRGTESEGHWVPDEGESLRSLLSELIGNQGATPDQIAMVTPFRDCAQRLKLIAAAHGVPPGKAGTVHMAQGKEADIVILVLGGNPRRPGAKTWAAAKPNLLNVAVSRMKKRLYVIGHRADWSKEKHFELMAECLRVISSQGTVAAPL